MQINYSLVSTRIYDQFIFSTGHTVLLEFASSSDAEMYFDDAFAFIKNQYSDARLKGKNSLGASILVSMSSHFSIVLPHHCLHLIFSRVLRDSAPRFVRPSVSWSVGRAVTFYFFSVFTVFGLIAPA